MRYQFFPTLLPEKFCAMWRPSYIGANNMQAPVSSQGNSLGVRQCTQAVTQ